MITFDNFKVIEHKEFNHSNGAQRSNMRLNWIFAHSNNETHAFIKWQRNMITLIHIMSLNIAVTQLFTRDKVQDVNPRQQCNIATFIRQRHLLSTCNTWRILSRRMPTETSVLLWYFIINLCCLFRYWQAIPILFKTHGTTWWSFRKLFYVHCA